MLLIGIVTNTKAFELVLIIHESHSSMEVFLGPCFLPCVPSEDGAFFFFPSFFFEGSSPENEQVLDGHHVYRISYFAECHIIHFFL
jgi:hypothetical protein